MADAADDVAGLPEGTVLLKWPNDLVVAADDRSAYLKLGGVLGETDGLGTDDPRAVVGLGVNVDWPAAEFPSELASSMTSLRAIAGDRPIDRVELLAAFVARVEARVDDLSRGRFDADVWAGRQATTGRPIELALPDGSTRTVIARGVDADSGALRFDDPGTPGGERSVVVGEIQNVRLARV